MKIIKNITVTVVALIIALIFAGYLYGNIIEYGEIGYKSAYFTDLIAKISIYVAAFLVFAAVFLVNKYFVGKNLKKNNEHFGFADNRKKILIFTLIGAAVCAVLASGINYETVLLYLNKTPFNENDVIFGKDISFYMFELPFYKMVSEIISWAFLAGTLYTAVLYYIYSVKGSNSNIVEKEYLIVHIMADAIFFFAVKSVSLYLKGFEILFGNFTSGLTGTGITGVYFWKKFYLISPFCLILAVIFSVLFLIKRNKKGFIAAIAAFPVLYLVVLVSAGIFQGLYVNPREVTVEAPYISANIEATKKAYGIDDINERIFAVEYNLTKSDIEKNASTVENIRITDNNATLTVANALQATRGYYNFGDVDIIPYDYNGTKRGISTAVRELDVNRLDATSRSYINTKMRYTHGYGIVMSSINSVTSEGQPDYIIQDVPLKQTDFKPEIKVPQIYYGEFTNSYSVVGTSYKELDYMKDGETVETSYTGEGGTKLSPLNRLYYSLRNSDYMMLISGYINSDSRILVNRNIVERAKKIAPYLVYDNDPYIVVNENGGLTWIIDAYTVSDKYPFSQKYADINYIRNSIKVTVDAYDGTVNFYITDDNDPLALAYGKIYPDVYKHGFPEDLAQHIRYPEFLFKIQMDIYGRYHVTDPETFYSKSDIWITAKEKYNNSEEKNVEPYYNVMKFNGNEESDMVLMLPFIPQAKQNLIAWVGVSSNYDTYGDMVVYRFPEGSPVNGTLQIENLISSDPEISKQISLWDQGDSNVLKGNLLVIPIENSIIYVEPLYITSGTESSIPQVKRILMAYDDKVVMSESLDGAFSELFGADLTTDGEKDDVGNDSATNPESYDRLENAREIYSEVKAAFEAGDWALFGEKMEELEKALENE